MTNKTADSALLPLSKPGVMTEMDRFVFECFGYIVIEEQIAFVDQRTRKVELVVPRWGE